MIGLKLHAVRCQERRQKHATATQVNYCEPWVQGCHDRAVHNVGAIHTRQAEAQKLNRLRRSPLGLQSLNHPQKELTSCPIKQVAAPRSQSHLPQIGPSHFYAATLQMHFLQLKRGRDYLSVVQPENID